MLKEILINIIYFLNILILIYVFAINFFYLFLNTIAFFKVQKYTKEVSAIEFKKVFQTSFYKPISVIVPAYNEEKSIIHSVNSMLQLEYPQFEVVVVNDGSNDNTLELLKTNFKLKKVHRAIIYHVKCEKIKQIYISDNYANLVVVDKEPGGKKSDASNAGINISKYPIFCSIDGDSLLEKNCLLRAIRPFIADPTTIAVGGIIRILNGCNITHEKTTVGFPKNNIARFQVVEYLRAFLFGRVGLDSLNSLILISGAFGMFNKAAVIEVGGYRLDAIGEDMDLTMKLHKHMIEKKQKYKITFVPDPVCWTEAPETLKELSNQRNRWQRGLVNCMIYYRKMLLNPKYKTIGLIAMPSFLLFEMLSAIIEIVGFVVFILSWYLGYINFNFALIMIVAVTSLGIILSINSICLEELSFRRYPKISNIILLFFYSIFENFGYRQINVWWRFKGTIDYFKGKENW